jgi:hypothetical protein
MVGSPLDKIYSFTSVNDCAPIEDNYLQNGPIKDSSSQVRASREAGEGRSK